MSTENEKKATHAVIYTDGGCRPSRGIGGWGIHGYLFRDEAAKQGTGLSGTQPSKSGYKKGASGLPEVTITAYIDGFGAILPETTNNQAEIMAAIKGFEAVKDNDIEHVTFLMDSQYTLQGINEWMPNWARNNWVKGDGNPVSNADLWKRCHEVKSVLDARGVTMLFSWVKGHSGELGNHLADRCATRAIHLGRQGSDQEVLDLSDPRGYWNYKNDRNRMFAHAHWYFAAGATESYQNSDGRHVYYLGDPREDEDMLGKKMSEARFSVIYLSKPEPVLNMLRDAVAHMGGDQYQALTIGYLRDIFKPEIYQELETRGAKMLNLDRANHRVTLWDHREKTIDGQVIDSELCRDIRPARLAYRAIEELQSLEQTLDEFLKPSANTQLRMTDLTDLLYEADSAKKKAVFKLKAHVTSALRFIDVDCGYAVADGATGQTKVRLTLGQDTPDRNTLAALAGEDTKVTLVTWPESQHAIRFAVVIESDGDVGIWAGVYSNLHMLTAKP